MKILKIFGIVVGIHVFALILIFANPGCTSKTSLSAPPPAEPVAKADPAPAAITMPAPAPADSPVVAAPISFDPNAPAISAGIRYSPTRPGTPAASALEAEPVADVTPATTYTVGKGDSLWSIAHKNHLTKAELAAANNLKPESTLRQGQKLIIPGKAVTAGAVATPAAASEPVAAAPKGSADSVKHIVKPGETLGAIARKYQVKVGEIATANNIADPAKIHAGMELIIPGWQTPAAKPGKTSGKASPKPAVAPASKGPVIPTIVIPDSGQATPGDGKSTTDNPPVISVEDVPAPKKP